MTPENEEAFPYGEVVKLAEKHGGTVIDYSLPEGPQSTDTTIIISTSGLAALISEVQQRVARECAETEIYVDPSDMTNLRRRWHSAGVEALRGAIRATFLTGEEGK